MKAKERLRLSLAHREPDRVPLFELMINRPVAEAIMARPMLVGIGGSMMGPVLYDYISQNAVREFITRAFADHIELYRQLDLDAVVMPGVSLSLLWQVPEVLPVDEYTFHFQLPGEEAWWVIRIDPGADTWGEIDHYLCHEGLPGLKRLVNRLENSPPFVPPAGVKEFIAHMFAPVQDRFLLGNADVFMPNHNAWFSLFLEAMITAPELIERFIAATGRIMRGYADLYADLGFDGIIGGTDFAGINGPFFSPAMFERFYAAPLRDLVSYCHEHGLVFIKHSDGNITRILRPLLLDSAADGFHAIEPAAGMDIYELKKTIGPRLSLWGNVDCGRLLCEGRPEEVRAEVRRLIAACSVGGGFVLSSSNSIHSGVKPENFLAMLDEARRLSPAENAVRKVLPAEDASLEFPPGKTARKREE